MNLLGWGIDIRIIIQILINYYLIDDIWLIIIVNNVNKIRIVFLFLLRFKKRIKYIRRTCK